MGMQFLFLFPSSLYVRVSLPPSSLSVSLGGRVLCSLGWSPTYQIAEDKQELPVLQPPILLQAGITVIHHNVQFM